MQSIKFYMLTDTQIFELVGSTKAGIFTTNLDQLHTRPHWTGNYNRGLRVRLPACGLQKWALFGIYPDGKNTRTESLYFTTSLPVLPHYQYYFTTSLPVLYFSTTSLPVLLYYLTIYQYYSTTYVILLPAAVLHYQ